jgi:putative ABC transport system ATP-binding protein
MRERVKVRLEPDHVSVWPEKAAGGRNGKPWAGNGRKTAHIQATPQPVGEPIAVRHVSRTFTMGVEQVHALQDVSLDIPPGALAVVQGPSGSGKTTLLNLIAGLDEPTSGTIALAGMSAQEKVALRRHRVGFVFQTFGLLPFLSLEENVEVPLRVLDTPGKERRALTEQVLEMVAMSDRARHRTQELSGGEQQRVAIARALVKRPSLILAGEPTGRLDTLTGADIISLLKEIVARTGVTVVVASHDPNVREAAHCVFQLRDGRLVAQHERKNGVMVADSEQVG